MRVLTSWRFLASGLVLAVLVLVGLASSLERDQAERTLNQVVAEARMVSELLLEVNLRPEDLGAQGLRRETRARIDAGVEVLEEDGRLVGLQLVDRSGRVLYSDSDDAEGFSEDEQGLLGAVLAGRPQVEFEHDGNRSVPTATVLIQPEDAQNRPSGLIAEVLLPQDDVAAELAASSRRLYGTAGALLVVLVGVGALLRRRMLTREREARTDPLTGLGNRALLTQAGRALFDDRAARRGTPGRAALLLLDLDGFKTVNDTLGHGVGDRLLVEVATTLRQAVRPDDVVTRLGGDEFAVLLHDLPDAEAALRVARGVSDVLHRPFVVDLVALEVGASVGVAVTPEHGQDLETLLRRADVAMYQAKRDGGGVRLYDEATDPHDERQLGLLSQLRTAIENDQLRLHFQPKATLREGRVVGFEALVRWQHPELGLLAPGAFVPLAERTALMRPLTAWVLREAIGQCARWRAGGWEVDVAVNIAPVTLLDPDFPGELTHLLAHSGLSGHALELEITETAVMVDPVRAAETLRRLQVMGVSVSIDDFGAGYTSLSYLKSLPVRGLKIDRGFVTSLLADDRDEAVARSVVSLGHDLGLTVVAEGVETADVRQRLLEMGCDEVQGYLLGRPMPADDVQQWLTDQHLRVGETAGPALPAGEPAAH